MSSLVRTRVARQLRPAVIGLGAVVLMITSLTGCGEASVTIENPLGQRYSVTSNEAAMFNELTASGMPATGFVSEILSYLRAACKGPDELARHPDRINALIQRGFTQEQIVRIADVADRHQVCSK